jgi:hypothetical protein
MTLLNRAMLILLARVDIFARILIWSFAVVGVSNKK